MPSETKKIICQVCGSEEMVLDGGAFRCKYCKTAHIEKTDVQQSLLCTAERELDLLHFENAEDMFRDFAEKYPAVSAGYWGIVRAKYGIKYVTDVGGERLPVCHASKYEDISKDGDFLKAVRYAENEEIKDTYKEESRRIKETCEEWRETVKKYDYDVFISFKATNEDGSETKDTREMQNLYTHLTEKGYKVFFAPVSMRAFVGKKYDAYILNALDKARAMILYGSKAEYFTAPWVRTEWTRYLRMIAKGEKSEGSLLVTLDGVEAKGLPYDLRQLQALDGSSKNLYAEIDGLLAPILKEERKKQEKYCLACGAVNSAESKFCSSCGHGEFCDSYKAYEEARFRREKEKRERAEREKKALEDKLKKIEEEERKKKEKAEKKERKKVTKAERKATFKRGAKTFFLKAEPYLFAIVLSAFVATLLSLCYAIKPTLTWLKWTKFMGGMWTKLVAHKTGAQWALFGMTAGVYILSALYVFATHKTLHKRKSTPTAHLVLFAESLWLFAVINAWIVFLLAIIEGFFLIMLFVTVTEGEKEWREKKSGPVFLLCGLIIIGMLVLFAAHPDLFMSRFAQLKALKNSADPNAALYQKLWNEMDGRLVATAIFFMVLVVVGFILAAIFKDNDGWFSPILLLVTVGIVIVWFMISFALVLNGAEIIGIGKALTEIASKATLTAGSYNMLGFMATIGWPLAVAIFFGIFGGIMALLYKLFGIL